MIRHALPKAGSCFAAVVSISPILALALAIPISLAGVTISVRRWLEPVIELGDREGVVVGSASPASGDAGRRAWMGEQAVGTPEWRLMAVGPEELAERLSTWFPYLEEVLEREGPEMLPPMVEIRTRDP